MRPRARGSATIRGCTPRDWVKKATRGARRAAAPSWSPVDTQPDRRDLDRPARRLERAPGRPARRNIAGKSAAEKRTEIGDWLAEQNADAAVLSALDSIAWAFNIRGARRRATRRSRWPMRSSTPTAPPTCSSRSEKIGDEVRQHLGNGVRLHERDAFERALAELDGQDASSSIPSARSPRSSTRWRRPAPRSCRCAIPTILPKAIKNPAEIAGHQAAQARDGAALVALPPLDRRSRRPRASVDELTAADQLAALRRENAASCATCRSTRISGAGPNGAIVHYQVERGDQPHARAGHALPGRFAAANMSTAPPTSPAPSPIGEPTDGDARPLHPRAQGPYRASPPRSSPTARAARSSTASRGVRCGKPGSITPTAPATASAASSRSTKGRSASRRSAARRPAATSRCRPA